MKQWRARSDGVLCGDADSGILICFFFSFVLVEWDLLVFKLFTFYVES